jgi:hypothetical protein
MLLAQTVSVGAKGQSPTPAEALLQISGLPITPELTLLWKLTVPEQG